MKINVPGKRKRIQRKHQRAEEAVKERQVRVSCLQESEGGTIRGYTPDIDLARWDTGKGAFTLIVH